MSLYTVADRIGWYPKYNGVSCPDLMSDRVAVAVAGGHDDCGPVVVLVPVADLAFFFWFLPNTP